MLTPYKTRDFPAVMEDCSLAKKAAINTLIYASELNENAKVVMNATILSTI